MYVTFSDLPIPSDELYIWVDKRYADMEDTFGIAQAWYVHVLRCTVIATCADHLPQAKSG